MYRVLRADLVLWFFYRILVFGFWYVSEIVSGTSYLLLYLRSLVGSINIVKQSAILEVFVGRSFGFGYFWPKLYQYA